MAGRGAGQAATWLPQLATSWEKQEMFDIHWCILGHKVRKSRTVKKWNQTFHLLPTPGISTSMLLARVPQHIVFRRIFKELQPDLIHCWGTENLHGAALDVFDGPSILSMQGIIHTIYKTGALKGWRWELFKHWEPKSLMKAAFVTSESTWGLDRIHEIVADKPCQKIEYGVFPSYYDVEWNPSHDAPEILYAGGLSYGKGVDILFEMLKQRPALPWKMVFAGSGGYEKQLRTLDNPSVEVLGNLTTQELQLRMSRAWALVHPSRADTSPNVVKEARVIGLPIVGSPHGGHAEYIENGEDGYIIESEDPEEWFQKLDRLANDYDRCRAMGEVHHACFRDHFRPEKTAEAFLKLYQQMLS